MAEELPFSLCGRDPADLWAEQDDMRRGCKSCSFRHFHERRGWFCALKRAEYPNGGEGICGWYKRGKNAGNRN